MRQRFFILSLLFPIGATFGASGAIAQVPVTPPVVRVQAHQDSAVEMTLRRAREALANVQRLVEDTSVFAAANRAAERAAALSAQLSVQQAALDQMLQQMDARLSTVFQQVERIQRRVDEMVRQQPD